jgi:two-component system, chemotaxis family, sensor kinase CheA
MAGRAPQSAEFIAEAKEHLADVCDHLLRCERATGDAARTTVEGLLRAVHSVKGGAGFFGFSTIETVAHRMESLLERMQTGEIARDGQTVDVLLAATDRIGALLDDADHSNEADVATLLARLDVIQTPHMLIPSDDVVEDSADEPGAAKSSIVELQLDLLRCEAAGLSPLMLLERLAQLGEIVAGRIVPASSTLAAWSPQDPVVWEVQLRTSLDKMECLRRLDLPSLAPEQTPTEAAQTAADIPALEESEITAKPAVDRGGTMRVPVGLADQLMNLAGELVLVRNQSRQVAETSQPLPAAVMQRLDAVTRAFQDTILQTRMQPVGVLFNKFPRLVRDLARQLGKQLELRIEGAEVELDKTILDAISDPLTHLVRNACDHGVESPNERVEHGKSAVGRVTLSAQRMGDEIRIAVSDDGAGIDSAAVRQQAIKQGHRTEQSLAQLSDSDVLALVLLPGLSTAETVSEVSGRGVGMDVVKSNLAQLGGAIEIESAVGQGTTFTLRLPLTLAIIPSVLVTAAGRRYAIPQKDLEELVYVGPVQSRARIEQGPEQDFARLRDRLLPLVNLAHLLRTLQGERPELQHEGASSDTPSLFAVVKSGARRFALVVDSVLSSEEIVVKPMHPRLRGLKVFSGATILGDGHVALILDPAGVAATAQLRFGSDSAASRHDQAAKKQETQAVLLLRTAAGDTFGVPVFQVRRLAMVRRAGFEQLSSGCFLAIDGLPTRLISIDGRDVSTDGAEIAFALLPRDVARAEAIVVDEVLGTELVDLRRLSPLPDQPHALGVAQLRGRTTPVVDLYRVLGDELAETASQSAAMRKILLVDDTQFFREVVGGYLESAGYEVAKAEQGAAALERLRIEAYDLIISDLEMPVMDGWTLAKEVRALGYGSHQLGLLALSTLSAEQAEASALASGFDAYEVKLDRATLLATVASLLAKHVVQEAKR